MNDTPDSLFAGFKPAAIPLPATPLSQVSTPDAAPKKPRKPRAAKVVEEAPAKPARKPRKARKPKITTPAAPKPVRATSTPAPQPFDLQAAFAAMKGLQEVDHPVFEKLLADAGMRARITAALGKLFP